MDYRGASEKILELLDAKLPDNLFYHGYHHTLDVLRAVIALGKAEGAGADDLTLLKTAALLHDAGFIRQYEANEAEGAAFAREILPEFGYSPEQIEQIAGMILATAPGTEPETQLQKILCDADLDYLGRDDVFTIAHTLRHEREKQSGKEISLKEWYLTMLQFLKDHRYHTEAARKTREPQKQSFIAEIEGLLMAQSA